MHHPKVQMSIKLECHCNPESKKVKPIIFTNRYLKGYRRAQDSKNFNEYLKISLVIICKVRFE